MKLLSWLRRGGWCLAVVAVGVFSLMYIQVEADTTTKSVKWQEISATDDETTSEVIDSFGRGGSIITEDGSVTFTVYGYNPLTGNMVHLENIASTVVADDSAKQLGTEIFGFEKGCIKLNSGSATVYWISAE